MPIRTGGSKKMEEKLKVIYTERCNPFQEGINYIAVKTDAEPPYVWGVYSARRIRDIPILAEDLVVFPMRHAKNLLDFNKEELSDLY